MDYFFIYRNEYSKITENLNAGLLYAYLDDKIRFYKRCSFENDVSSFTYEEICDDICLSQIEVKRALRLLNELNLIEIKTKIVKGIVEISIKINQDEYEKLKKAKDL